ncbi:SusD/RagB family nutrient-binding outer membrane lipoprotein [Flavobacterium sp. H122]|uniref:SusD/RagB family nutrient-binding outer membrane lipoprotein n=1 Tax=Flavobacterium sp. H122 TaxID=2529860 RepID=UPI0010AA429E|nr:SusD/RagB family nutrient-binding outer membrane lipoprotein [Flavobacterium sp. H122]
MKKYIIALSALVMASSCATDEAYDSANQNPNKPTQVTSDALFTSATKTLFDQNESTSVNSNIFRLLSQYWTETTYIDEANYDLVTRNIPQNYWSNIYRNVLFDLKDAKTRANNANKKAMIEVVEVYTWQQMVDTFGDIPYSAALQGSADPTPVYDDAADIYADLLVRLNSALANFNPNPASVSEQGFTTSDVIYHGDINHWLKFANSLKLKIAMRLSDVNASVSKTAAEQAVAAGVFTSNSDNATIQYEANPTNANPLWVDLVQSNRTDFVVANTVVDYMNAKNDPRREFYFDDNLVGGYEGGTYGASNNYNSKTHIGDLMHQQTFRGVLLDYSEVQFLLAEAAARTYNTGSSVTTHYNNAITASMQDWGVSSSDITTYLLRPDVAYATAAGDWRQKIGFQFWLAMYNRGHEGWSVYRKFDTPAMNVPPISEEAVPTRLTYPLNEQTLNKTNYTAAASAIGGDLKGTKLFWDVN